MDVDGFVLDASREGSYGSDLLVSSQVNSTIVGESTESTQNG